MRHFAEVDEDGRVIQQIDCEDDEEVNQGDYHHPLFELSEPLIWASPTPTSGLWLVNGVSEWRETALLSDVQAAAILRIDRGADAARLAIVGDAARIKEYERAQLGAEQYRDAGFTGPVPPGVASWAYAKRRSEWTAQQAAEDILAASARWYAALDGIRALRLEAKEAVRFSVTCAEVEATASYFRSTLTAAMEGVQ